MGEDSLQLPGWRAWIGRGAEAFAQARYSEAVSAFQKAAELSPGSATPHLYLALGWMQQHIPGADSAENAEYARRAEAELRRALDLDPASRIAAVLLGQFCANEKRLEESREWYRMAKAADPANADICCALGAVTWRQWLGEGKAPNALLEEAISDFERAAALDPAHGDAMQYLSLLLRERGDLAAAGRWQDKSDDARAEQVQSLIAGTAVPRWDTNDPDLLLTQWASLAVMPPPPPLPPPPLPAGWPGGPPFGAEGASVSWEPLARGAEAAAPMRVPAAVQSEKLVARVDPSAAATEVPMRFVVVIGMDGRIVRETLISGNIWLVPAAVEALREWVYEPTLVNGKAVEVVTEVRVKFQPRK